MNSNLEFMFLVYGLICKAVFLGNIGLIFQLVSTALYRPLPHCARSVKATLASYVADQAPRSMSRNPSFWKPSHVAQHKSPTQSRRKDTQERNATNPPPSRPHGRKPTRPSRQTSNSLDIRPARCRLPTRSCADPPRRSCLRSVFI